MAGRRETKDVVVRLECAIIIVSLLFASFSFSGCTIGKKETSKKEMISDSKDVPDESECEYGDDLKGDESDGSSEIGQITDDPDETEPEEDLKPRALEIAAKVGLSEEDLRGEYELFVNYATAVVSNPGLHEYKGYMYSIFPLVADHLESENEEYFLEKVSTLYFENVKTEDLWGGFSPDANGIIIGIDQFNACKPNQQATGVYHELMHFIDYCIDGPYTTICLLDDGNFANTRDYPEEEWENLTIIESPYWCEGGSEKYYAQYFTHAPDTGAYRVAEQFLVGLEYIFGSELVDELFFAHDTDLRFVHLLQDNDFTNEEILKFYNVMNLMIDRENIGFSYDELLDPQETLIRLYINNVGPAYETDAPFCRILASMEDDILKPIPSQYRDFTDTLHLFTGKEEANMMLKISSDWHACAIPPVPLFVDGELKLAAIFFEGYDDETVVKAVIIDYDFDAEEIVSYEIFDDWVPESLIMNLPTDDMPEARELIAGLTADNSEAHSKKIKGKQSNLTDQYARAEAIGNKYGIRFWFADLTPDGVLFAGDEDVTAWDPDRIDQALDQIEKVLALYPEDYFDQFLFECYTGIAICLYDGYYEFEYPYSNMIKHTNYLTLYVDISLDTIEEYPGANDLSVQNFPNVHPIAGQLICDIWMMTEEIMSKRDEHFDKVTFSEESWETLNPSGFEYFEAEYWGKLYTYARQVDMQYFVLPGSLYSAKNDRMLCYEYLMLAALTGEDPLDFASECLAKMDEILSMIRFYFETDQWPDQTSWEAAIG